PLHDVLRRAIGIAARSAEDTPRRVQVVFFRRRPAGNPSRSGTRMTPATLDDKVQDFLAQKRIAVAGVSRGTREHQTGNLIYRRLKETGHDVFPVNPNM